MVKFNSKVQMIHHPHQSHEEVAGTDIPQKIRGLPSAGETGSHSAVSLTAMEMMFTKVAGAM